MGSLEPIEPDPEPIASLVAQGRMPAQLRRYWISEIAWRQEGAFRRCVAELLEHGVPPGQVNGACANLHKRATGKWPAEK